MDGTASDSRRQVLKALVLVFCLQQVATATSIEFVVRGESGEPIPCRVHLRGRDGKPKRAPGQPFWHDHFVCQGEVSVDVAPGAWSWEIERGPEHTRASGTTEVAAGKEAEVKVTLQRIADLGAEGWYSGDLHVHRSASDIELLMRSEDLDFAPVIDWWNRPAKNTTPVKQREFCFDGHRIYTIRAGEDEREGGALLYFGLYRPLDLTVRSREFPSPMHFVGRARQLDPEVWIDIEKPFWKDVPTWLASGQMQSIGLANNHMCRSSMLANEAWGRPRDARRLPPPLGNAYWSQEIYYRALDCGLRLAPSAGSASGVLPNPVGYNRVWVHLGGKRLTRDAFFRALSAGRCFVSNGPLLRVRIADSLPGGVFELAAGEQREVAVDIRLTTRDRVAAVEIVHNGRIAQRIPCADRRDQDLSAKLVLDKPGWILLRAIADVDETFRFASTGPWYVETAEVQHRISKPSAVFFRDWVDERIDAIRAGVSDPEELRAVLEPHQAALEFWTERLRRANANLETNASAIEQTIEQTSAR